MKTVTIEIPDGCEVQIVKKKEKKESVIRTYQDLAENSKYISGYFIDKYGNICYTTGSAFK